MARKKGDGPVSFNPEHAKTVRALSQYGVPQDDIAATIGCCVETMQKLYSDELAKGRALANAKIGKRLFEKAMEGDVSALIFWAKCRMRWRTEDSKTGDDEPAVPAAVKIKVVNGRRRKASE